MFKSKKICFCILYKVIYCISLLSTSFFDKNKARNSLIWSFRPLLGKTSPSYILSFFILILLIILSIDDISFFISLIFISYSSFFIIFSMYLFPANSKRVFFISSKSKILIDIDSKFSQILSKFSPLSNINILSFISYPNIFFKFLSKKFS